MNSRTAHRVRPQIGDRPLPRTHWGLGPQVSPSHPIPYPLPSFLPYPSSCLCLQSRSQRQRSFLDGFQQDCEQSLFFFRFSKGIEWTRTRAAKPRDAPNEGAISLARGHLRVSRFARRTTEERETARSLSPISLSSISRDMVLSLLLSFFFHVILEHLKTFI